MPNTKSAKKALIQSRKRKVVNLKQKTRIKKLVKKALVFAKNQKLEELQKLLPTIYKTIDKGVKNGILKKNTASRRKSLIAKKLNPPKVNKAEVVMQPSPSTVDTTQASN